MSAPLSPSGGNDQKAQVLDLQELVLTQIGFVDAFDKYLKTACKAIPMSLMVQKGRILEAVQKRDFERAENLLHALEDQRKPDASREIMNSLVSRLLFHIICKVECVGSKRLTKSI